MTTEGPLHERLSRPFNEKELKFFPVAMSRDGKTAKVGSYVDARAVEDRLDEEVGPGNWQSAYRCIDPGDKAVECTLSLLIDGVWVGKADVGYPNEAKDADNPDKEPWKAAYSDALKRAAVQWGIGRYIYSIELERDWLPVDQYKKFTEQPRLKGSRSAAERPAQKPVQAAEKPATPPKPPLVDWIRDNLGFSPDEITALSRQMFDGKTPDKLGSEQKKRLVMELEDRKKKEVA